ncbi:MAG: hypothetical protein NT131_08015, partial [Methanomassiliicoccales archaeon]|nr:hypothetical protein [Methanomassiliicoccales archaeon]
VFNFLVWVASGGLLLLFVHLVEIGLEAIGNMLAAAAAAVQDAVDAIVDAFCAFVDWIKNFAAQIFEQFFNAFVDPIINLIDGYCGQISIAAQNAEQERVNTGEVSLRTIADVSNAILGDLFQYLLVFSAIVAIAFLAIKAATLGMTALLGIVISIAAMFIIEAMLNAEFLSGFDIGLVTANLYGSFTAAINSVSCSVDGAGVWVCNSVGFAASLNGLIFSACGGVVNFAWALAGCVLGIWSWLKKDRFVSEICIAMGVSSLFDTYYLLNNGLFQDGFKEVLYLSGACDMVGILTGLATYQVS